MSIPDPALCVCVCVCVRERKREQNVFIVTIKTKCNSRWAKMSVTDPPLGPLPNIVKAGALYTNYNTFSKEKYVNMSQRMY